MAKRPSAPEGSDGALNLLAGEKSPYLLQHASNPVHWHPWGDEAFERAARLDRPVFLSIGYATCHWCHVMERESFEDAGVARLLNESFVSVKVDREERPDLDHFYMTVCQGLTGSGGWPLTLVLTPDKEPFFAGTYFPRESRHGRIGMLELVPRIAGLWKEKRTQVLDTAGEIVDALRSGASVPAPEGDRQPGTEILDRAFREISSHFDVARGGFGKAPKFPQPAYLRFLLSHWKRTGSTEALRMAEESLTAMRRGGIYDHIGFGFHRYSTDEGWLLPHFEKMLYDQALLAMAYTEAWLATKNPLFRKTAEEILDYVLRDLKGKEGGFCSAEDADSEGEEGLFYLWTHAEVAEVLDDTEAGAVAGVFGLKEGGNFTDELGDTSEKNIFHLPEGGPHLEVPGISEGELAELLEGARRKLFARRERRVRPLLDDKVLTDWNGLMIAALAKAASAFGAPRFRRAAERAARFILETLEDGKGVLLHRYRDGAAELPAHLDDYAFFSWGLIELYEDTFDPRWLAGALRLTDAMNDRFWDGEEGGFFFTSHAGRDVPVRQKILDDGSVPSGNSVAAVNLLRLSRLTGVPRYEEKAAALLEAFAHPLGHYPTASCHLLGALEMAVGPSCEVVIAGDPQGEDTARLLDALRGSYGPNRTVLFVPESEERSAVTCLAPFAKDFRPQSGKATAYVCSGFQCAAPTSDIGTMLSLLEGNRQGADR